MGNTTSSSGLSADDREIADCLQGQSDEVSDQKLQAYIMTVDPAYLRKHDLQLLTEKQIHTARAHFVDMITVIRDPDEARGQLQWVDIASILEQCLEMVDDQEVESAYLQSAIKTIQEKASASPQLANEGLSALVELAFAMHKQPRYAKKVGGDEKYETNLDLPFVIGNMWEDTKDPMSGLTSSARDKLQSLGEREEKTYGRLVGLYE